MIVAGSHVVTADPARPVVPRGAVLVRDGLVVAVVAPPGTSRRSSRTCGGPWTGCSNPRTSDSTR